MSNVAIIPARGGSKRIPLKNIREFNKTPMLAHTIRVLKQSECFSQIIVSTDSDLVADCANKEGGVSIAWRNSSLASDTANTVNVVASVISQEKIQESANICCVYAPNPFLHKGAIRLGLSELEMHPIPDYVSTVTTFPFPIQRSLKLTPNGKLLDMAQPEHILTHSQNLELHFHETAQFWWAKASTWLKNKPMQLNMRGIYIPRWMTQDIDTFEDWKQAEIRWKILELSGEFINYTFDEKNIVTQDNFSELGHP